MVNNNLAAPCGIYCGACRQYLVLKKNQLKQRGFKRGCEGCRIRNKNCAFIKRDCPALKKNQINYCYECDKFPCQNLRKMDDLYKSRYNVNMIGNLEQIKKVGPNVWLQEQKLLYSCPKCGGEICIHDEECYDCGYIFNPNK